MSRALDILRSKTAGSHHALERDLNVVGRLQSDEHRLALKASYERFHAAADDALSAWFGGPVGSGVLASRSEAVGFLYVVCGSRLGAKMIRKSVGPGIATDFLTPTGVADLFEWKDVFALIERELTDETTVQEAVTGALKAFDCARLHLAAKQ